MDEVEVKSNDIMDMEFIARSLIAALVTGSWSNETALRKWLRSEVPTRRTWWRAWRNLRKRLFLALLR
jgi:hypothetical protein